MLLISGYLASRLSDQLARLMKIHQISGYIQQIYLAEYPDKLLLLDGASRADVGTILRYIRDELNRPVSDLKAIVVTHMHPDHAGAAHRLKALTGAEIVSNEQPKAWYAGIDGVAMHLTDLILVGIWQIEWVSPSATYGTDVNSKSTMRWVMVTHYRILTIGRCSRRLAIQIATFQYTMPSSRRFMWRILWSRSSSG